MKYRFIENLLHYQMILVGTILCPLTITLNVIGKAIFVVVLFLEARNELADLLEDWEK